MFLSVLAAKGLRDLQSTSGRLRYIGARVNVFRGLVPNWDWLGVVVRQRREKVIDVTLA